MMTEIAMAADLMLSSHPTYSSDSRGTGSGPQIPQLFSQESVCHLFIEQLERNRYMPHILPFEVQQFFLFYLSIHSNTYICYKNDVHSEHYSRYRMVENKNKVRNICSIFTQ